MEDRETEIAAPDDGASDDGASDFSVENCQSDADSDAEAHAEVAHASDRVLDAEAHARDSDWMKAVGEPHGKYKCQQHFEAAAINLDTDKGELKNSEQGVAPHSGSCDCVG